jgi:hypothetical protein
MPLSHAIERRERLDLGESEPSAFQRRVAEEEPHRPRLGNLLDLVEIARGAVPVADAAVEGGAGDETAGNVFIPSRGAQTFNALAELRPSIASSTFAHFRRFLLDNTLQRETKR